MTPFELTARTERRLGLPTGTLGWRGPFAPPDAPDHDWLDVLSGRSSERGYWADRAVEFGRLTGRPGDTRSLIATLYDDDQQVLVRAEAVALVHEARAAGLRVGVLTNDLRAFHSEQWVAALEVLTQVDAMVDGSVEGVLKPDPRIYVLMAQRLGIELSQAVFLDDQPVNLAGASAVGMTAVAVDVTDPGGAFARARELLGLPAGVAVLGVSR